MNKFKFFKFLTLCYFAQNIQRISERCEVVNVWCGRKNSRKIFCLPWAFASDRYHRKRASLLYENTILPQLQLLLLLIITASPLYLSSRRCHRFISTCDMLSFSSSVVHMECQNEYLIHSLWYLERVNPDSSFKSQNNKKAVFRFSWFFKEFGGFLIERMKLEFCDMWWYSRRIKRNLSPFQRAQKLSSTFCCVVNVTLNRKFSEFSVKWKTFNRLFISFSATTKSSSSRSSRIYVCENAVNFNLQI